jgi:hypothetical protein
MNTVGRLVLRIVLSRRALSKLPVSCRDAARRFGAIRRVMDPVAWMRIPGTDREQAPIQADVETPVGRSAARAEEIRYAAVAARAMAEAVLILALRLCRAAASIATDAVRSVRPIAPLIESHDAVAFAVGCASGCRCGHRQQAGCRKQAQRSRVEERHTSFFLTENRGNELSGRGTSGPIAIPHRTRDCDWFPRIAQG